MSSVSKIKTTLTVDPDGTQRMVAVSSKKLTTSMKVGLTDRDHMPSGRRIDRLVKPYQRVHSRVPERGHVSKELRPTSSRRIRTQRKPVVEHMTHDEFKEYHYQHPVEMLDKPLQKCKVWRTEKGGVQAYSLHYVPQLKYSKPGAVRIDRVNGSKSSSMNLEVGSIYLKKDPCTGKRTMVNQKKAVVTRDEKRAQRLAHAASKRKRRGYVERKLACTSAE